MQTDSQNQARLTGVILAGGRATRMQGRDKGLIELQQRPFIQHVIERLQPQVDEIRINANRNLDDYRRFGFPVFRDANQDFQGPLSGMLQGLRQGQTDWVVYVPCDAPQLSADLVARFKLALDDAHVAAVAHDGKWMQPAFCMLHRSLADRLENYIAAGGRKTSAWLRAENAVQVDFSDQAAAFVNLNSPDDLHLYLEKRI